MACFIVPLTQAVATTIVRRNAEKNTSKSLIMSELPKLELMLWGGSGMLVVDHIINGEVTAVYPFFTALAQEGGAFTMLNEMLTVGLPMSALVTAAWGVMVALKSRKTQRA